MSSASRRPKPRELARVRGSGGWVRRSGGWVRRSGGWVRGSSGWVRRSGGWVRRSGICARRNGYGVGIVGVVELCPSHFICTYSVFVCLRDRSDVLVALHIRADFGDLDEV